jgi:5-keto 4-deoxyuronate isomerase
MVMCITQRYTEAGVDVRFSTDPVAAGADGTAQRRQPYLVGSWSVHGAAGTANSSFPWFIAGENYLFEDMDLVPMAETR